MQGHQTKNLVQHSSVSWLAQVVAGAIVLGTIATMPANAQVGEVKPLDQFRTQDSPDPLGLGNNAASSMMNLIHRANLGGLVDSETYRQQQRESINDAASDFRARQLELLRQQQQSTPNSGTAPQVQ